MARVGTLPENAYFKELTPIQGPVRRPSKNPHPTVENEVNQTNEAADDVEEIPQYESESDDGDDDGSSFDDKSIRIDRIPNVAT